MSKFQVGDTIRHKASGYVGTILSGNDAEGYSVRYPCDDEEYFVRKNEIDFVDSKGAFLQRLQALLREFDADISFDYSCEYESCETIITIGDTRIVRKEVYGVTADNILDFDKE